MALTVRDAGPADFEPVIMLMREYYELDGLPFDERRAMLALAALACDLSLGRVWLLTDEEAPIGYAVLTFGYSLEYHGRDAFVDEVYIRASHRGRGFGKHILSLMEDECRARGVQALHLEVQRHNRDAQRIYRKAGFEDHDRYLMTKWISPRGNE